MPIHGAMCSFGEGRKRIYYPCLKTVHMRVYAEEDLIFKTNGLTSERYRCDRNNIIIDSPRRRRIHDIIIYDVVGFLTCVALPTSVFYTSPVQRKVLPYIFICI